MSRLSSTLRLGYCTNVHPGETWDQALFQLKIHPRQIKAKFSPNLALHIGLWLSAKAARTACSADFVKDLKNLSDQEQFKIFSFNGFPYGDFHAGKVKEKVFFPDWTSQDRVDYTLDLIRLAAAIGEPGLDFSISTVPVSYQNIINHPLLAQKAARHLSSLAWEMEKATLESGIDIHLDLEPEPFCFLEKSSDVISFFKEYLLSYGSQDICNRSGISRASAEDLMLRKIRICYDTCHSAVEFETPIKVLNTYQSVGIRIGKVQLSSAIEVNCNAGKTNSGEDVCERLSTLSGDRYLHQVIGISNEKKVFFSDLGEALHEWSLNPPTGQFRIHYHIPIFLEKFGCFGTTQEHMNEILELSSTRFISSIWEVETYTWDLLGHETDVDTNIARELSVI